MAESRRYGLGNQLDIEQILLEAQHRWLRPAEICEILRNYKQFSIAPEPAVMPSSGSLFLFDRKVLRYFRKDGHNWRKKKDGKTVKEAHERLKAGSVDVLHCYYAHGQENENFQRRSYWMLEEHLSHIVLVHYREVKGNRANFNRIRDTEENFPVSQETEEFAPNSEMDSSMSSNFRPNSCQLPSQTTDTTSLNSVQASEYEDAESAYNNQVSPGLHPFLGLQQMDAGLSSAYFPLPFSSVTDDGRDKLSAIPSVDFISLAEEDTAKDGGDVGFPSWEDVLENCGSQSVPYQPSFSLTQTESVGIVPKAENELIGHLFSDGLSKKQDFLGLLQGQQEWQDSTESNFTYLSKLPVDQKLQSDSIDDITTRFTVGQANDSFKAYNTNVQEQNDLQLQPPNATSESSWTIEGKANSAKNQLLDGLLAEEGLKKIDSFNRWMSKELGDVDESHMQSSSSTYWETIENENGVNDTDMPPQNQMDTYMLGPSLSHDQLFSIIDFSPNWAYAGSETKVLMTGKFLKSQQDAENCKWSCMFGEVEVPAEIVADGVLRCRTPVHEAGRVPFYVTCSNRLACSEVREFEYRSNNNVRDMDNSADIYDTGHSSDEMILCMRFGKLLSLTSVSPPSSEKSQLSSKISSKLKEEDDGWLNMLTHTSSEELSSGKVKEQLLQKLLKEKLIVWLVEKACEGGKGASVLDEGGQGVLHFAAALGYDWAIEPTILAGVSINFRDVNGWTALHWAASCGRERIVVSLVSLGAAPGALTDPTFKHPSGQTPADLASSKRHKGIAGYLAEAALSAQLNSLNLKEHNNKSNNNIENGSVDFSGSTKAVQTVSERSPTPINEGDLPHGLSLKDSLAAVCNATQAAARIHQVFRVQSFQKKQLEEYGDDKFGISDERALSLIVGKSQKQGQHGEPVHAAAIRIQNKFRSWKGRKDFLIIRQRIVKIQAHVRGHQVRKNYRKIIWSVGILDKVILRWRRKGCGLRGFKSEALIEGSSMQDISSKDDDYDFLKEGRKQTEERLQKALARVKSMVQYPEARDQYRRLLNAVSEIQETKVVHAETVLNNSEETANFDDDLIDLEELLDDDTFMSPEY